MKKSKIKNPSDILIDYFILEDDEEDNTIPQSVLDIYEDQRQRDEWINQKGEKNV